MPLTVIGGLITRSPAFMIFVRFQTREECVRFLRRYLECTPGWGAGRRAGALSGVLLLHPHRFILVRSESCGKFPSFDNVSTERCRSFVQLR